MTIPFESYRAITAGGSSPFDTGEGRALTRRSFPMSQRGEDCVEAVGQGRRSRLQNQRRFDLDDAAIPYSRDRIPAGSLPDLARNDLLAAPRRDNDVGRRSNHVMWRDNSVFGGLLFSQFGKHILATGDLDEFRDPADAADERIIPLLEINLRLRPPMNRRRNVVKASFVNSGQAFPPYLPLRPKRQWCESSRECPQQMPFGCGSTWGSLMSLALSWAII